MNFPHFSTCFFAEFCFKCIIRFFFQAHFSACFFPSAFCFFGVQVLSNTKWDGKVWTVKLEEHENRFVWANSKPLWNSQSRRANEGKTLDRSRYDELYGRALQNPSSWVTHSKPPTLLLLHTPTPPFPFSQRGLSNVCISFSTLGNQTELRHSTLLLGHRPNRRGGGNRRVGGGRTHRAEAPKDDIYGYTVKPRSLSYEYSIFCNVVFLSFGPFFGTTSFSELATPTDDRTDAARNRFVWNSRDKT